MSNSFKPASIPATIFFIFSIEYSLGMPIEIIQYFGSIPLDAKSLTVIIIDFRDACFKLIPVGISVDSTNISELITKLGLPKEI